MKHLLVVLIFLVACTQNKQIGSAARPIHISMVPTKDTRTLLLSANEMKDWLEKETGYKFEVSIPTSYVAVVEAFGGKKVDIAYLNTTTYLMAREKYGVEPQFITTNINGETRYKGQFIARADSKIKTLKDLHDKKMAYVDPTSASGYILPAFQLKQLGVKPKEEVFAGRHDAVVAMVYQKQVDAGATFYALPENGKFMDARHLVETQFPDVGDKIKIIDFTVPLANDAFVFRKEIPEEIKVKVRQAMVKWEATPEGKTTLKKLSNASGFKPVTHAEYEESEKILKEMRPQP